MIVVLLLGFMCVITVVWALTPLARLRRTGIRERRSAERGRVDVPLGHAQLGISARLNLDNERWTGTRTVIPERIAPEWVDRPNRSVEVAGPEELLRAAKHEGAALRRSLENPAVRSWARDAIDSRERRVERLIERGAVPRLASSRAGPITAAAEAACGLAPEAESRWLELRIDHRIAELDRMIDMLWPSFAAIGRSQRSDYSTLSGASRDPGRRTSESLTGGRSGE